MLDEFQSLLVQVDFVRVHIGGHAFHPRSGLNGGVRLAAALFRVELIGPGHHHLGMLALVGDSQSSALDAGAQIQAVVPGSQRNVVLIVVAPYGQECAGIKERTQHVS